MSRHGCKFDNQFVKGEIENPELCLMEKLEEPMKEFLLSPAMTAQSFFFKYEYVQFVL